MRIAIDTNVLIAALTKRRSSAAQIVRWWREGELEVVSSDATLREAQLIVGAPWLDRIAARGDARRLLDELRDRSVRVRAPRIGGLGLKDKGDLRLVEAAVAGHASYLVTADREVLLRRGYGPTEFVMASEFLRRWKARTAKRG